VLPHQWFYTRCTTWYLAVQYPCKTHKIFYLLCLWVLTKHKETNSYVLLTCQIFFTKLLVFQKDIDNVLNIYLLNIVKWFGVIVKSVIDICKDNTGLWTWYWFYHVLMCIYLTTTEINVSMHCRCMVIIIGLNTRMQIDYLVPNQCESNVKTDNLHRDWFLSGPDQPQRNIIIQEQPMMRVGPANPFG
jgi:hypothetical protein